MKEHLLNTLLDEDVEIVPYNFLWPRVFQDELKNLRRVLKEEAIEHIGSTAVPNLSAKPIIDIMIGVKEYPPSPRWIKKIVSLGYVFYGEAGVPLRLHFTKRADLNVNLSVVELEGTHWKYNLLLRNFLREHPEACKAYEEVKKKAIHAGATKLLAYSKFKHAFLQTLLKQLIP